MNAVARSNDSSCDALIIGAGPIGIETAVALQKRGKRVIVVDAGAIGSTLVWWAPGTKFFSSPERIAIAGVPMAVPDQEKATREDYLGYLRQVVGMFAVDVRTFTRVTGIERTDNGFEIRCVDGRIQDVHSSRDRSETGPTLRLPSSELPTHSITASNVVLAVGNMHRPRLLGIPGENLPHVSHYLADPHSYYGRRVVIVGGKNSAVEAAIRLYRVGAHVTVSYRRPEFDAKRIKYWLLPELEWLISKGHIDFMPCTTPVSITREGVQCECTTASGSSVFVRADDVLLLTGYEQDGSLFEQVGVALKGESREPVFDRKTMQTNVPGVYVAGTAVAGTETGGVRVFIENAHTHTERIAAHICGEEIESDDQPQYGAMAES
jgi:thioredoxin reductase (NADPH)